MSIWQQLKNVSYIPKKCDLDYLSILKVLMNALSYQETIFWPYISFICPKFVIGSVGSSSLDIKCPKIGKIGKKQVKYWWKVRAGFFLVNNYMILITAIGSVIMTCILREIKKIPVVQPVSCTIYRFSENKYNEMMLKLNVDNCS